MGDMSGPHCFSDIHRCVVKLEHGDLKNYTIRERMAYVDAQMTEFMCGIHPFTGAPRPEGYYIERVNDHLPDVLIAIARAATVVRSIVEEHGESGNTGFPPPLKKERTSGPRPVEKGGPNLAPPAMPRKQTALEALEKLTSCKEKVA